MLGALLTLVLSGAPELNTEGFRLYQSKNYSAALEKFRGAIAADEKHALAHYNYAATLGLLRKQGKTCEFDAYQPTILEHLTRAVELNAGRRKRMQADGDFDSVRDTLGYQKLLGRNPANDKDVPALLVALAFLSRPVGAFGQQVQLDLKADGTFTLMQLVVGDDVKRVETRGTWRAKGRAVTLKPKTAVDGRTSLTGTFNTEGALVITAPEWNLSSERSDCDA